MGGLSPSRPARQCPHLDGGPPCGAARWLGFAFGAGVGAHGCRVGALAHRRSPIAAGACAAHHSCLLPQWRRDWSGPGELSRSDLVAPAGLFGGGGLAGTACPSGADRICSPFIGARRQRSVAVLLGAVGFGASPSGALVGSCLDGRCLCVGLGGDRLDSAGGGLLSGRSLFERKVWSLGGGSFRWNRCCGAGDAATALGFTSGVGVSSGGHPWLCAGAHLAAAVYTAAVAGCRVAGGSAVVHCFGVARAHRFGGDAALCAGPRARAVSGGRALVAGPSPGVGAQAIAPALDSCNHPWAGDHPAGEPTPQLVGSDSRQLCAVGARVTPGNAGAAACSTVGCGPGSPHRQRFC